MLEQRVILGLVKIEKLSSFMQFTSLSLDIVIARDKWFNNTLFARHNFKNYEFV